MNKLFQTVSVIGLGYIGLPTAAMLASKKVKVIGVDTNLHVVATINRGEIHIVEPEFDLIVSATVSQGYLKATNLPEPADAFLIAVPTPFMDEHEPDLKYVEAAVRSIAPVLKKGDMVILESTSPVGTTESMAEWLASMRPDLSFPHQKGEMADVNIAYCPERVLPGKVVHELVSNNRVIGGMTRKCSERAISLYKIFVEAECIPTDARTAEMCKLTENSYRDVNIAFANELSMICDKLGISVWELIQLSNRHPRVNILQPGPGVGGHCIAVDPWFIVSKSPQEARLIRTAREVNDSKPEWVLNKVKLSIAEHLLEHPQHTAQDVCIACLGLAFKPDIDDLRESPSVEIVQNLSHIHPGKLLVVEPNVEKLPEVLSGKALLVSLEAALKQSSIILILVGHKEFKGQSLASYGDKKIINTCGIS